MDNVSIYFYKSINDIYLNIMYSTYTRRYKFYKILLGVSAEFLLLKEN